MSGVTKALLVAVGTVAMGLGVLGILVPLLPTTPFLLLAAACYARSSQRFHRWLLANRYLGQYIRDYQERRGMSRRAKVTTLALLWVALGFSAGLLVPAFAGRLVLLLVGVGVTLHILSLNTIPE